MLDVQLGALNAGPPPGVEEALDLVAAFDDALAGGLGRLGEQGARAVTGLAAAVAASPLGDRAVEAAEKVATGSVAGEHLTILAGARAALLGAVADALLASLDDALGRSRTPWPEPTAGGAAAVPENLLAGPRSWLHELAITGWRGVGHDLVAASDQAVEAMLAEPALRRPAVLLDGLAAELRASSPVATMEKLPARRWADLWTRALMLTQPGRLGAGDPGVPVSGRLLILGADVHEHATAVQVQVHGLLEPKEGGEPRLVRTAISAAKVDTIVGAAVWGVLGDYPVLLGALARHLSLDLTDMPLLAGGDLLWDEGKAVAGELASPFATARVQLAGALATAGPPLDRHPVAIAEPVLVEGYKVAKVDGGIELRLDGQTITVAADRLPGCGPLTPQLLATSTACLGLLRWDGRWLLQPLAVQSTVKRQPVAAHNGDWALGPTDPKVVKSLARSGDAVAVLRERAGRLLRK
ncbi:hypothetical protein [Nonomuraea cavernae]|uniref:Uncharacterized protein n=1 Tax=Nonomuraea cavernae TaxID=2045107 RepID=A0A918DRI8_9ACTN|nr:hypothetical protein [Nonomuraea cavernae]MCA2189710.1 hypothetical protein [Nonomuraea cavernae]GGO80098.1 hypothetical protein GCM10012289_65950 [Nonomuraea cavernae]